MNMGPIHALALQLLANKIIALKVKDATKVGKDNLKKDHLFLISPIGINEEGIEMPSYLIKGNWTGLNTIESQQL